MADESKKGRPDKSELVNEVMRQYPSIPSWEAWAMSEAELTKKLEG